MAIVMAPSVGHAYGTDHTRIAYSATTWPTAAMNSLYVLISRLRKFFAAEQLYVRDLQSIDLGKKRQTKQKFL